MTDRSRRDFLHSGALMAALASVSGLGGVASAAEARIRVISDNDYSGDPDGLFQLAHHALSPSVAMPLVVGSHLHPGEVFDNSTTQASNAAAKARELLKLLGKSNVVAAGAEVAIPSRAQWQKSPATDAIVQEAMRTDTKAPLYYVAGAGLTDIALAWLTEPRIGRRLKLVWIGGNEHPALALPPENPGAEYNLTIDLIAARIIFNESDIEIWQVPRDAYRQMLFSFSELGDLGRSGVCGRYLKDQVDRIASLAENAPPEHRVLLGETYVLGDNPLVTLTALQSAFQPDPASSRYTLMPTPKLNAKGDYIYGKSGRPMRVYTHIDAGFTFRDMISKIKAWDASHP